MAKKSKIVKNQRRAATVARYASRRTALKDIIRSPSSAPEQRSTAQRALARQPRDASPGSLDLEQHELAKRLELGPQAKSVQSPEFAARLAAAQHR